MRGRLSIAQLFGVKGLVPGLNRPLPFPSQAAPRPSFFKSLEGRIAKINALNPGIVKNVEGRIPKPAPMNPTIPAQGRELFIRRWNLQTLSDDLSPITPRDTSSIPSLVPGVAPAYTPAPSGGGFWNTIASGITGVLSSVVPAVTQIKTQQILTQQGAKLYTPANITTLQHQAEYEAMQRQIDQGRQLNTTSLPMSGTALAMVAGAGLLVYLIAKKK